MPLFEFRCSSCEKTEERLVRSPAPDSLACSSCGQESRRLVSLPARSGGDCGPEPGGT